MREILLVACAIVVVVAVIDGAGRQLPAAPGVTGALSGMSADQVTQEGWADALLETLRLPSTQANLTAVIAWETQESGAQDLVRGWAPRTTGFNPLGATQREPGSHTLAGNPDGVQVYTSWDYGLQATADTLRAGNHGFPAVMDALAAGNDAGRVRDAVVRSGWGTKWFPV